MKIIFMLFIPELGIKFQQSLIYVYKTQVRLLL